MRTNYVRGLLAGVCLVAATGQNASAATIVTGGEAGEGLDLHAPSVVAAIAVGALAGTPQVVQGVPFYTTSANNPYPTLTFTTNRSSGGGSGDYITQFAFDPSQVNDDDTALKTVVSRLAYGGSWVYVQIGGLTPNTTYTFDVLTTLGKNDAIAANNYGRDLRVYAEQSGNANTTVMDSFTTLGVHPDHPAVLPPLYRSTFQYATDASGIVRIGAVPGAIAANSAGGYLSGVIVSVPEPSSLAAIGLLAGFAMRRRTR